MSMFPGFDPVAISKDEAAHEQQRIGAGSGPALLPAFDPVGTKRISTTIQPAVVQTPPSGIPAAVATTATATTTTQPATTTPAITIPALLSIDQQLQQQQQQIRQHEIDLQIQTEGGQASVTDSDSDESGNGSGNRSGSSSISCVSPFPLSALQPNEVAAITAAASLIPSSVSVNVKGLEFSPIQGNREEGGQQEEQWQRHDKEEEEEEEEEFVSDGEEDNDYYDDDEDSLFYSSFRYCDLPSIPEEDEEDQDDEEDESVIQTVTESHDEPRMKKHTHNDMETQDDGKCPAAEAARKRRMLNERRIAVTRSFSENDLMTRRRRRDLTSDSVGGTNQDQEDQIAASNDDNKFLKVEQRSRFRRRSSMDNAPSQSSVDDQLPSCLSFGAPITSTGSDTINTARTNIAGRKSPASLAATEFLLKSRQRRSNFQQQQQQHNDHPDDMVAELNQGPEEDSSSSACSPREDITRTLRISEPQKSLHSTTTTSLDCISSCSSVPSGALGDGDGGDTNQTISDDSSLLSMQQHRVQQQEEGSLSHSTSSISNDDDEAKLGDDHKDSRGKHKRKKKDKKKKPSSSSSSSSTPTLPQSKSVDQQQQNAPEAATTSGMTDTLSDSDGQQYPLVPPPQQSLENASPSSSSDETPLSQASDSSSSSSNRFSRSRMLPVVTRNPALADGQTTSDDSDSSQEFAYGLMQYKKNDDSNLVFRTRSSSNRRKHESLEALKAKLLKCAPPQTPSTSSSTAVIKASNNAKDVLSESKKQFDKNPSAASLERGAGGQSAANKNTSSRDAEEGPGAEKKKKKKKQKQKQKHKKRPSESSEEPKKKKKKKSKSHSTTATTKTEPGSTITTSQSSMSHPEDNLTKSVTDSLPLLSSEVVNTVVDDAVSHKSTGDVSDAGGSHKIDKNTATSAPESTKDSPTSVTIERTLQLFEEGILCEHRSLMSKTSQLPKAPLSIDDIDTTHELDDVTVSSACSSAKMEDNPADKMGVLSEEQVLLRSRAFVSKAIEETSGFNKNVLPTEETSMKKPNSSIQSLQSKCNAVTATTETSSLAATTKTSTDSMGGFLDLGWILNGTKWQKVGKSGIMPGSASNMEVNPCLITSNLEAEHTMSNPNLKGEQSFCRELETVESDLSANEDSDGVASFVFTNSVSLSTVEEELMESMKANTETDPEDDFDLSSANGDLHSDSDAESSGRRSMPFTILVEGLIDLIMAQRRPELGEAECKELKNGTEIEADANNDVEGLNLDSLRDTLAISTSDEDLMKSISMGVNSERETNQEVVVSDRVSTSSISRSISGFMQRSLSGRSLSARSLSARSLSGKSLRENTASQHKDAALSIENSDKTLEPENISCELRDRENCVEGVQGPPDSSIRKKKKKKRSFILQDPPLHTQSHREENAQASLMPSQVGMALIGGVETLGYDERSGGASSEPHAFSKERTWIQNHQANKIEQNSLPPFSLNYSDDLERDIETGRYAPGPQTYQENNERSATLVTGLLPSNHSADNSSKSLNIQDNTSPILYSRQKDGHDNRYTCGFLCFLALIFVVLGVSGFVISYTEVTKRKGETTEFGTVNPVDVTSKDFTVGPTSPPTLDTCMHVEDLTGQSDRLTKLSATLGGPFPSASASRKALCWLSREDEQYTPVDNMGRISVRFALAKISYQYPSIRNQTNWGSNEHECQWEGIECDLSQAVIVVDLGGYQLGGSIPSELSHLNGLKFLRIPSAGLTGTIPEAIYNISGLNHLDLSGNSLNGTISPLIENFDNLVGLDLHSNSISGSIPPQLFSLTSLRDISLWENKLRGTISTDVGSLSRLQLLLFARNRLTGEIPSEIGLCTQLRTLDLSFNTLNSELVTEIGKLTKLRYVNLDTVQLRGTIPSELGSLVELEELKIAGNPFIEGTIPTELGNLVHASTLYLASPRLTGTVPEEICAIAQAHSSFIEVVCERELACQDGCCRCF